VIAVARGTGGGRSLLLNAHMDTVGVTGMEAPFEPRVEDGRLYGRGSFDMKGGLAAIMLATAEARRRRLRGDVVLTAVADEEHGSIGSEALVGRVYADAVVVAEPTGLKLCLAHKGFVGLELETIGRAAHGSRPDLGVDAIAKMGHVLVGLERIDRSLRAHPSHLLLRSGSLHAGVIDGGQEFSSYPERCVVAAERRTIPGETAESALAEVSELLDELAARDPDFIGSARVTFSRDPMETAPDDPFVRLLRGHAGEPEIVGESYWTDAGLFSAAGIPSVVFGPGGEGAHAMVEWVELEHVERCAEVLTAVAVDFCA
jgi:acetylornithine deacetylase